MNKPTTLRDVRTTLKKMSLIGSTPIKLSKLKRSKKGKYELTVSSPTDLGPACAIMIFTGKGNFIEAAVFEPGRISHCLDEGLTMDQSLDESMRYVDTVGDVHNFLERKPYQWDGKKKWLKGAMKT